MLTGPVKEPACAAGGGPALPYDRAVSQPGGRPTIRDVAQLAGVSPQTVSNVINNRPVTRPATRRRVEDAIRELGYERDALARALRLRRTHALGFLMEDQSRLALHDPAHASLLTGMVERARHHEYTVTVYVVPTGRVCTIWPT